MVWFVCINIQTLKFGHFNIRLKEKEKKYRLPKSEKTKKEAANNDTNNSSNAL